MDRILLYITLSLLLTACGFSPAYKINTYTNDNLSSIEVMSIPSIEGTYFYNHLKSILPPLKEAKYYLNVKLNFIKSYNIIQPNSDILRETQNISVNYQLIDKKTLKIVHNDSFIKINSYSVNSALYSNTVLRQESVDVLAESAADEVRNRLIIFFSKSEN